ncbi:phosphatase PAP2 family protein [Prevotella sp. E15-22]|uniref:phosphatase PAP2 family protein n=1 Tax=Prevotella sp. E15-22 TaxID=2937774 RepID=UPI002047657F|nr:phosphatase PAP2 family protein [Prevotella sp. E15-22]UPS44128.1 phosphatase PAP2 family protein [Prevotella sp. E15-22]
MKNLALIIAFIASVVSGSAENYLNQEPLKLQVPELKPELVKVTKTPLDYQLNNTTVSTKMDFDFFTSKTNPNVKANKVMDDLSFAGVPLFLAGIAIKGDKANFRQDYGNAHANTRLLTSFKTRIDDYTQFFGPAMTVGLKLGGVEGRSDWPRLFASAVMSYGIMAGFVNGIKYTAKEMRPDGSTANSWPSGHTATSFVGATLLHKEYGLTRSPWYSVAGYGVATATGIMRILNNRHWISDVMSGAGIGIMSTELGYALSDVLFKNKGLLRGDLEGVSDRPSFFAISMGMSYGLKNLTFHDSDEQYAGDNDFDEDSEAFNVDFHTASVVDIEGAYFLNKYVGIGGRLRVRAMTAKGWSNFIEDAKSDRKDLESSLADIIDMASSMPTQTIKNEMQNLTTLEEYSIESDHLTEFSANVGLYFNLPLSSRFALGSKLLIGRSMTQELDINAHYQGDTKNMAYDMNISDGYADPDKNDMSLIVKDFYSTNNPYDIEWDYLTLGGNNSTNFGTGLSLTYRYKSNFSWRLFCDYDFSKKEYTLTADPLRYLKVGTPNISSLFDMLGAPMDPIVYKKEKNVSFFTIGASFAVNF